MDNRDNLRVPLGQLNVSNNATESAMMAGSTSNSKTMKMDTHVRDLKISARLWIDRGTVTGYVDMHIAYRSRNCNWDDDRGAFGTHELSYDQYAICSVYLQIGKLLGVRPRNGKDSMFKEMYRNWSLSRHGVEMIRTLDDVFDGDHLTLTCGLFHKSTKLGADFMQRLPSEVKHAVRVRLISPLRSWNHDASGGSSESNNSSNKQPPKIAAVLDKRIATADRRPIVGSVLSESKDKNKVIVILGCTIAARRTFDTMRSREMANNNRGANKGNNNHNTSAEDEKENYRPMHPSSNNHHHHPNNTRHHPQIRHSLPPNSSRMHHPVYVMGASSSGGDGSTGMMGIAPILPPPPPPPPMGVLSQQQHQPHLHHRGMLPPSSSSGSIVGGGVGCHPNMSIGISTGGLLSVQSSGAPNPPSYSLHHTLQQQQQPQQRRGDYRDISDGSNNGTGVRERYDPRLLHQDHHQQQRRRRRRNHSRSSRSRSRSRSRGGSGHVSSGGRSSTQQRILTNSRSPRDRHSCGEHKGEYHRRRDDRRSSRDRDRSRSSSRRRTDRSRSLDSSSRGGGGGGGSRSGSSSRRSNRPHLHGPSNNHRNGRSYSLPSRPNTTCGAGAPRSKSRSNELDRRQHHDSRSSKRNISSNTTNKERGDVIVISSDDESETSGVEDVTDEWRAKRDEERRGMKENAEEID